MLIRVFVPALALLLSLSGEVIAKDAKKSQSDLQSKFQLQLQQSNNILSRTSQPTSQRGQSINQNSVGSSRTKR